MQQSSNFEKKIGETSEKIASLGRTCKKGVIMGHAQNNKLFWQKEQKQIISFQKLFILSKYNGLAEL